MKKAVVFYKSVLVFGSNTAVTSSNKSRPRSESDRRCRLNGAHKVISKNNRKWPNVKSTWTWLLVAGSG